MKKRVRIDRCECCGAPLRSDEGKVCRGCELAMARMLQEALEAQQATNETTQAA
ncbi:MAG: hypothetical protein QME79_14285 [Bacillota bacterium]|nr:hypothetical protein [Bacillota bacterium]